LGAAAILIYGAFGEWYAITALYNRSSQGEGPTVLTALLVLMIAVAALPALRFSTVFFSSNLRREAIENIRKSREEKARERASDQPKDSPE
jgi:hypothetical protein